MGEPKIISARAMGAIKGMEGAAIERAWRETAGSARRFRFLPGVGKKVELEIIAYGIWKGLLSRGDRDLMLSLSKAQRTELEVMLYSLDPVYFSEYADRITPPT